MILSLFSILHLNLDKILVGANRSFTYTVY